MQFQGWRTWATQKQDIRSQFFSSSGRPNLVRQDWLFVILFFYLMIWCRVCAPSRGNGREELPLVSFAQGFIFAKPQNILRVKNILHCLRGNETKYRETQILWITQWNTKHKIIFKTYINNLLLPGREIGITTVLLFKKKREKKNKND